MSIGKKIINIKRSILKKIIIKYKILNNQHILSLGGHYRQDIYYHPNSEYNVCNVYDELMKELLYANFAVPFIYKIFFFFITIFFSSFATRRIIKLIMIIKLTSSMHSHKTQHTECREQLKFEERKKTTLEFKKITIPGE